LAKDFALDYKNRYSGQKLSRNDVEKLASLITQDPKVFEKMKENQVPLDIDTIEKLRTTSAKDAFKLLDTIVKEKDLKINITMSKGTRCPEISDPRNVTLTGADKPLITEPVPDPTPPEEKEIDSQLPTDNSTRFTTDDDFNNLSAGCENPSDMNNGKVDDAEKNKSLEENLKKPKIIYLIRPLPQKKKEAIIKRTINQENVPKPADVLGNVELKKKGDQIILPNGNVLATIKGIPTGLNVNDPKIKEKLLKEAPKDPNDPEQGKSMVDNIQEEIKKNPDLIKKGSESDKPDKEELENFKLTVTLIGSWLEEPGKEAGKQQFIQDIRMRGDNAFDLFEKLRKINEAIGK